MRKMNHACMVTGKKRAVALLCAALAAGMLAGCGTGGAAAPGSAGSPDAGAQAQEQENSDGQGSSGQNVRDGSGQAVNDGPSMDAGQSADGRAAAGGSDAAQAESMDLQKLTSDVGNWCMSDAGYYYITSESMELKDGDFARRIMYMDFASRQEVFLCSSAGCKHDTADCTAVLSEKDFPHSLMIFYFHDMLYVMAKEDDEDGTMATEMTVTGDGDVQAAETETEPAVLYRMNPDGTERTKVYEFDAEVTVEDLVYGSGEDLYFIAKKLHAEKEGNQTFTTSSDREIVKLNTSSREAQTVYSFAKDRSGDNWSVIGSAGSRLVLQRMAYDHEMTEEERRKLMLDDDAWREQYETTKDEIAVLDLSAGAQKTVYTTENHLDVIHQWVVGGGKLFLAREDDPALYQVDLDTGKQTKFIDLKENNLWGIYGDQIVCSSWKEGDFSRYFVNIEDGSVKHCTLTIPANGWNLEIRGEVGDQYFLVYDYDCERDKLDPEAYEINQYKYALIDKEDLFHSKAEYRPIKMIGKGE